MLFIEWLRNVILIVIVLNSVDLLEEIVERNNCTKTNLGQNADNVKIMIHAFDLDYVITYVIKQTIGIFLPCFRLFHLDYLK